MQKNELKSGVILSYINLGLGTVIPFIYTPIMLRMLGQAEYGLFSLASSAVSYLSLLSFGFGSTIIRYISKYRAEKDKKSEEKAFGFFLILYCVLALLVLLCGAIIANNVEAIFQKGLSANELKKMKVLVMIMTFNSALSFPNSVFSSMITANEKYIFRKLVDMFSTVLAPLANLVALYLGYASVGMATAATVVQFLMLPVNIYYCLRKLHIKPVIEKLPIALIKEMLGFSVFVFIGSIVDMLFWATDKVILGMLLGGMMAIDMGGPINKAAYVFGTASIASGNYDIMAAVMIGGMVPPLAIALATFFFKNRFTKKEQQTTLTNVIMGLSFITEGAIPFAASDPLHILPACVAGSAVAGALSMFFNCTLMAPHGGIFVIGVISNPLGYLFALAVGSVVGMFGLALLKKPLK